MKTKRGKIFTLCGPDVMSEEMAVILCGAGRLGFDALFQLVHAKLRARNAAYGAEEILRLRVYERLQEFVRRGMVDKLVTDGVKEYVGLAELRTALPPPPGTKKAVGE